MLADLFAEGVISVMDSLTNLINQIWGSFDSTFLMDGITYFNRLDYYFPISTIVQVVGLLTVIASISWAYKLFVKFLDWITL